MSAYDLADEFKNRNWDEVDCVLWCEKSANMLRQQADRIAELEKLVHQRFDDGKRLGVLETEDKFKSPPCAWMIKTNDGKKLMLYGEEQPPKFEGEVQYIPLYTTPQTKPLSDEKIDDIWAGCSTGDDVIDMHQFARAIEAKVRGEK